MEDNPKEADFHMRLEEAHQGKELAKALLLRFNDIVKEMEPSKYTLKVENTLFNLLNDCVKAQVRYSEKLNKLKK